MKKILFLALVFSFFQCKDVQNNGSNKGSENEMVQKDKDVETQNDTGESLKSNEDVVSDNSNEVGDSGKSLIGKDWVELDEADGFLIDIKYATTDNFTKTIIYDCQACYLRPEVAQALKDAQQEVLKKFGYGIKLLDCYRPQPFQQRLWDVMPDKNYVAPPEKGSMHSRGTAVDLTLVDKEGNELDMGTPFDYFGEEAHQDYKGHSDAVNRHRYILRSTMKKFGLEQIRTEWWHYSYREKNYPLEDWVWDCP